MIGAAIVPVMRKPQHVVKHPDGWAVRGEGNSKVTRVTDTQGAAIEVAREIAKNQQTEVVIHGRNGRIRDKDSYGPDSCPPRDTRH
jgi:uncharacterized protein YdaT